MRVPEREEMGAVAIIKAADEVTTGNTADLADVQSVL